MTSTDLTAEDVLWDLEPLLPAPDDAGLEALLSAAEAKADALTEFRGQVAEIDADRFVELMRGMAEVQELIGRAGSFAGLDFAADTTDPERGARMQKVDNFTLLAGSGIASKGRPSGDD